MPQSTEAKTVTLAADPKTHLALIRRIDELQSFVLAFLRCFGEKDELRAFYALRVEAAKFFTEAPHEN